MIAASNNKYDGLPWGVITRIVTEEDKDLGKLPWVIESIGWRNVNLVIVLRATREECEAYVDAQKQIALRQLVNAVTNAEERLKLRRRYLEASKVEDELPTDAAGQLK